MIENLFSIFDPSSYYFSMGWAIMATPILLLIGNHNIIDTKKISTINIIANKVSEEVNTLSGKTENNSSSQIMNSVFFMVATINLVAIMPINFTTTAHVSLTLYLSITIWISTIVNAISNSIIITITHLTPMGTPMPLINFMVIIELISNIIRPVTLAVRLIANIVAGHLLISLLSSFSIISQTNILVSTSPIIILITLETAVALIQGYVITILICLYYSETF